MKLSWLLWSVSVADWKSDFAKWARLILKGENGKNFEFFLNHEIGFKFGIFWSKRSS